MNRRQRKKKKAQVFTIILGCTAFCKAEQYEKMRKSVEYQLRTGSVVMLPAYLHVEAIAALDERLKRVESGWGIDYKHDAVLGLCYMGAAYMSQHYERTVETAVLGATYVGNSYLANTF